MRQIHHSPIRLPGVAAILFWLDSEAAPFYRVHPPSDKTTLCGRPYPPSMTPGPFFHRTGIIGPPSLRIRVHVGQQGLRRYIFEQNDDPATLTLYFYF